MSVPVGFPSSLSNEGSYSLPQSVSSYNIKVVPSNTSSVVAPAQTLTASSTLNLNGTSQNVIFDVPAGGSKSQFIDPRFSTLSGRITYAISSGASSAVITNCQLRSNFMSFFDRTYTQSNGVVLDDLNSLGVIADLLVQTGIDVSSRDCLSSMYGFQYEGAAANSLNANQGHKIAGIDGATLSAATSSYYSYTVPLISSLIGQGASKMFNIGGVSQLQVVLQTSAILPITIVTGTATTAAVLTVTLDNISLNLQVVDVGMEGLRMLNKAGPQYYNGVTYRASTATVPSGTSGAISLLTGIRASSVNAMFARFCEASTLSTTGCINYVQDSKAPLATSIAWNVNGQLLPSNPTDIVHNPSLCFYQTQQAAGNFATNEFKSGLVPSQYFVYLPIGTGSLPTDADKVFTASGTASSVTAQSQFVWGYNLQKVSTQSVLDGMNLSSGNTFLNMVWAVSNNVSVTAFFIAKMDIIYVLDPASGQISVRL